MAINQIPTQNIPYTRTAIITTTSTFVHPEGYSQPRQVRIIRYNGGNGGTGGNARSNLTNQSITGGFAGGSSFVEVAEIAISSNLNITIGAGGSGGAGGSQTSATTTAAAVTGTTGSVGGTTTVIGTGVNLILANTNFFSMFTSLTTTTQFGLSGGGQNASISTSAGDGGSNARGGFSQGNATRAVNGLLDATLTTNAIGVLMGTGMLNANALAPAGGGGGGSVGSGLAILSAGTGAQHAYFPTLSGNGGSAAAGAGADATGSNGANGGIMGNGGGGGGGASATNSGVSRTATGGNGGNGGAGGVIIYY